MMSASSDDPVPNKQREFVKCMAKFVQDIVLLAMPKAEDGGEPKAASTPTSTTKASSFFDSLPKSKNPTPPNTMTPDELFPDGDITFSIEKNQNFHVSPVFGWKLMTRNSKMTGKGKRVYKSCLGVHVCELCDFKQAPVQPASKRKDSPPPPPKTQCPSHPNSLLVHVPCTCTINLLETQTHWIVEHKGNHQHDRPPATGRLDQLESFLIH